jgi:hypothetical protein
LDTLYQDWFETYHISLPVDVEPVPGAVYPEPVGNAAIKEMEATATVRKWACIFNFSFQAIYQHQFAGPDLLV